MDFYPLDIDYITDSTGKPWIRLWGRSDDGKRVVVLDSSVQPYFWVFAKDPKRFAEELRGMKLERGRIVEVKLRRMRYLGKDVEAIKVTLDNPTSIQEAIDKAELLKGFLDKKERDISFYKRYLLEKQVIPLTRTRVWGNEVEKGKHRVDHVIKARKVQPANGDLIQKPRVLAFDIETYNYRGNPRPELDPIMMISLVSTHGLKKVMVSKKFENPQNWVEFVESEAKLIQRFIQLIREEKPDILIGYNSDAFDFPYLRERASKYKLSLELSLDSTPLRFVRRGRGSVAKLRGIVHLDLYHFILNVLSPGMATETYDLGSVAEELIGERKVELDWEELWRMWDRGGKDLKKLCDYCLRDSQITLKLSQKLLPMLFEIAKLVELPLFDVARMTYGQYVEAYLMKEIRNYGEIIPNRPTREEVEKRARKTYVGAYVHEPSPGLYEKIVVFDFRSLYPSIIASHNISPDTLNCKCCKGDGYLTPKLVTSEGKKVSYWFCKRKKGFIPAVIANLIERRVRIKEIMSGMSKEDPNYRILDARQFALKTIANASYGYLGFARARWYSLECAEATTAWGRYFITQIIKEARKFGFEVIYGNTDSVMFSLGKRKRKDAEEYLKRVNQSLPGKMELEFRDFYPRGIFVLKKGEARKGAKKKYVLVDEKGNIIVRGFEYVRRDWAEIAKLAQARVFEAILKERSVKKALKEVQDIISALREQKVDLKDVTIYTQLTKAPDEYEVIGPHVAAAKRAMEKGYYIEPGCIIKYVIAKGPGKISDKAYPIAEFRERKLEYDPDYYIEHQVIPAVGRIFEILGYSEDMLRRREEKLEKFFKK